MKIVALMAACSALSIGAGAETLTVGPGRQFARIEDAHAAAQPGDAVEVYPAAGDGVYRQVALYVTMRGLRFTGMGEKRIVLDGAGYDYSGVGSIPRAIFQMNMGADGVMVENFELRGAHNGAHNGAGVRINEANRVAVRRCEIHGNDMGIMSNGAADGTDSAREQLIEFCIIHHNGDAADPGFNHNLYLGGADVLVQFCDVHSSLTGHNLKSRAHFNLIQYNYIHDSANRELDLVDSAQTARPNSHAVVLGNYIVKAREMTGNRGVIHFGQDGKESHDGTLFLINNTIVTTYVAPVVHVSGGKAGAQLINNIVFNPEQNTAALFAAPDARAVEAITGRCNWTSRAYDLGKSGIDAGSWRRGVGKTDDPGFVKAAERDFRLRWDRRTAWHADGSTSYLDGAGRRVRAEIRYEYQAQARQRAVNRESGVHLGAGVEPPPSGEKGEH